MSKQRKSINAARIFASGSVGSCRGSSVRGTAGVPKLEAWLEIGCLVLSLTFC